MHAGSIENPKSAAGRVYKILLEDVGCWFSGWNLTTQARVTAVGTRVSEVRHQLPSGQRIEHRDTFGEQRGSWYRLVDDGVPLPKLAKRYDIGPAVLDKLKDGMLTYNIEPPKTLEEFVAESPGTWTERDIANQRKLQDGIGR
jgi:hypothetical protein